jgi:DDE family transposase
VRANPAACEPFADQNGLVRVLTSANDDVAIFDRPARIQRATQGGRLDNISDPRSLRGRRWPLAVLLRAVLVALLAGCKSLTQAEALTAEMSRAARKRLGIARRIADTTMRDLLCILEPEQLRRPLHAFVRAAHRRKALDPDRLPFGVVARDGKSTGLPSCDDDFAQRPSQREGALFVGVARTMTWTLISSPAMPCIDVLPIPARTTRAFTGASRTTPTTRSTPPSRRTTVRGSKAALAACSSSSYFAGSLTRSCRSSAR